MIKFKEGNLRVPKWNRRVFMVAGGTTAYRKYFPEYKLEELVMMGVKQMLENNDLKMSPAEIRGMVNYCVYGEFADHFQDQLLCEAKVHDYLGFDPLFNVGVKTGGATGGTAILTGAMAVASGYADVCLVAGWERMDEVPTVYLSEMSEADIRAYVIAGNRLAENAGWDSDLLASELPTWTVSISISQ